MNYLKRIAIVFVLFLLIGTLISFFLPPEVDLEKTTVIEADKRVVQNHLKSFKYQSIYGYKITEDNESWEFNDLDNGLEVVSSVKFSFGFNPLAKFYSVIDKVDIDKAFQHKFDSIKAVLEELPKIQSVIVEKKMMENDIWLLSIRDTINQTNKNNAHGKLYEEINQFLISKKLNMTVPPLVIYHYWSDTLVDIEVGAPVEDSLIVGNERIKIRKIKKTNVVTATHYGPYERLAETYFGINEWMRKNKVVVNGPPCEIYITDPSAESNPKKWETAIYFPVD